MSFFKNIFIRLMTMKRKFQVDIMMVFLFLITLTVIVISSYTYSKTAASIFAFSKNTIERVSNSILEKLENFTQTLQMLVKLSATLVSNQTDLSLNNSILIKYMLDVLQIGPDLSAIYAGSPQGVFLGALDNHILKIESFLSDPTKQLPKDTFATIWYINPNVQPSYEVWQYRNMNDAIVDTETIPHIHFDPRQRPWYQGALEKKGFTGQKFIKQCQEGSRRLQFPILHMMNKGT